MFDFTKESRVARSIRIKNSVRKQAKIFGVLNGFQFSDIVEMALIKKLYNEDLIIRNGVLVNQ